MWSLRRKVGHVTSLTSTEVKPLRLSKTRVRVCWIFFQIEGGVVGLVPHNRHIEKQFVDSSSILYFVTYTSSYTLNLELNQFQYYGWRPEYTSKVHSKYITEFLAYRYSVQFTQNVIFSTYRQSALFNKHVWKLFLYPFLKYWWITFWDKFKDY